MLSLPVADPPGLAARVAEVIAESRRLTLAADQTSVEARQTVADARETLARLRRLVCERRTLETARVAVVETLIRDLEAARCAAFEAGAHTAAETAIEAGSAIEGLAGVPARLVDEILRSLSVRSHGAKLRARSKQLSELAMKRQWGHKRADER